MSHPYQQVLKLIPELTASELKQVQARISVLTQASDTAPVQVWLLDGIFYELQRRGLITSGVETFPFLTGAKKYKEQLDIVGERILTEVVVPLSTVEKQALGRLVARALVDYLRDIPGFGLRVMLQQVSKVPEALEASYPGYLGDGMLGMLVRHPYSVG